VWLEVGEVANGRGCSVGARDRGWSSAKLDGDKTERGHDGVLYNLPKSTDLSHYKTSIASWKRRGAFNFEVGSILRIAVFPAINAAHRVLHDSYNLPRLPLLLSQVVDDDGS
jgi:hypothetical protein